MVDPTRLPTHRCVRSARFQMVRPSVRKLAVVLLAAPILIVSALARLRRGAGRSRIDRVRAVQDEQRFRLRRISPSRSIRAGSSPGSDHACDPPSSRPRRGIALRGDRARRRPRPVRDPVCRSVHRTARPDPRHARSDRLRPARHRPTRTRSPATASNTRAPTTPPGSCSRRAPIRSAPNAPSTPPPTASPTSRRFAVAGGYEKLVLWGTSYGTKVAEEYAQEYPQHVEALILDSVVDTQRTRPARPANLRRDARAS